MTIDVERYEETASNVPIIKRLERRSASVTVSSEQQLKSRIAKQFSRAATRYDSAAQVQIDIANDALAMLVNKDYHSVAKRPEQILDIGCGTGRVTRQLANMNTLQTPHILAMDIAFGMLEHAKKQVVNTTKFNNISWLQGDAEHLPLSNNKAGAVFSSMALQWCKNSRQVCSEIYRVLAPGAGGVLAIMCKGSMYELDTCWQQVDSTRKINQFTSAETWASDAKAAGLQVKVQQRNYVTLHADVRALLGSLKQIGANVITSNKQQKAISRHILHALGECYQQAFGSAEGLPLTYSVCFLTLSKPIN
ncbi:Malonyl-[acyl-carrier protein] O-methyltransferase [Paraglaciecola mesophila]|uniref:Malonyl-[acyl-carrier protein] O-methyltransferase n=1 Tax=Paraglaciecola mesophila TaxID=197222 RepID=A0A857JGJ9_9ALTE|nr:malonyl-ACP O-methyltransferase BioC [Paraglaciecola mesophila]QHJ09824.1 Malonyl-[acyl-carrier protein] O-methyltransferase [Paraglaciecola mesophila]